MEHVIVEIEDHPRANVLQIIPACCAILDAAYHEASVCVTTTEATTTQPPRPPALLVHCASGISRSAAVIVAWLLCRRHRRHDDAVSLDAALAAVRYQRPLVRPNMGFLCQLQMLERHHGDIDRALQEWEEHAPDDILEHVARRRQAANEFHAQVDDLEVSCRFIHHDGWVQERQQKLLLIEFF
jgi:protein-tyrosine phosphatase